MIAPHDVGKISPGFQMQILPRSYLDKWAPSLAACDPTHYEKRHSPISEAALMAWGAMRGKNASWQSWGQVLGNHHGERQPPLQDNWDRYGGPLWQQERQKLLERLIHRFGPFPPDPPSPEQIQLLSGLTCVADWIGSDERFFPPEGLPKSTDLASLAENSLNQCGWNYPPLKKGLSFQEIFSFPPNSMQQAFFEASQQPGLYILEAPMGLGKTEAALYSAYHLMQADHNSGLYFALPTRLTSNRIHQRVNRFLETIVERGERARLVHGQAWLHELQFGGEEMRSGRAWFHPAKRALLLPFGVGTVDQALLGVLCVRHYFLRAFGLAGKVIILDEVHSYDVYTGTLIDELIQLLVGIGCTVIVLSATLTRKRRTQLLGENYTSPEKGYPSITSRANGQPSQATAVPPPVSKEIDISLVSNDISLLGREVVERARAGQCVLWIANTVKAAQEYYREVMSERREGEFPIGLLHARFPVFRREELEQKWMSMLGKENARPSGCVLIATQVVEQSVDIDADFMITDLAPTDMLLQRLGRLWRHLRDDRPCCDRPIFWIVTPALDQAEDQNTLKKMLGDSARVYAPYVLWCSFQVWRHRNRVTIPDHIRDLLESTYVEPLPDDPSWVPKLYEELERRRTELSSKALGLTIQNLPTVLSDAVTFVSFSPHAWG